MQRRKWIASLTGMILAASSMATQAQQDKPIEWVVGYAAGGGSDVVARTIADAMSKSLNRTIIVTNKPGAGTNIAAEYTARSKDYGNILFTADFATLAANPTLFSKLNYNAEKDFQPVGMLVRFPLFLVVSNSVPANNLKEFMAWAKTQPEGVNWGSVGLGSPHHLVGEMFREQSGLKMIHVPYRGAAPGMQDVIGGQISAMWVESATAYAFLNGKKVKAIGVASPQRVQTMPDAPTLHEQGMKGFEGYAWQGLVVPTGTPTDVTAKFSSALQTALNSTPVKARLQALGVEPMPGTAEQMATFSRKERDKWGGIITKIGVKLD